MAAGDDDAADEAAVQRDLPGGVAAAELAPRQVDTDDRRGAVGGESEQEERAAAGGADLEQPPRPRPLRRDRLEQAEHLGTHLAARELDAERRERERNVDERLQVGRALTGRAEASPRQRGEHGPQAATRRPRRKAAQPVPVDPAAGAFERRRKDAHSLRPVVATGSSYGGAGAARTPGRSGPGRASQTGRSHRRGQSLWSGAWMQ